MYGELQVLNNNNGANPVNSQGVSSDDWKAIKASDGTLITPNGSGTTSGSVKMDYISSKITYSTTISNQADNSVSASFANTVCDGTIGTAAKLLLANIGMYMYEGNTELFSSHQNYMNNGAAERLFCSGGRWNGSSYGLASSGGYVRGSSNAYVGFRSAFVELPTA